MAGQPDPADRSAVYYPSDMLDLYKSMKFSVGGEPVSIAVNAYRNNDSGSHPTPADGGTQDALSIKDALAGLSGDIIHRAGGAQSYVDVFTGKGTPEAIATVLQCLAEFSDRFTQRFGKDRDGTPRRKCADWLSDPDTSWQDTLQTISNEFMGLDCNGFVGNWLKRVDHALMLGPQQGPKDIYNKHKIVRQTIQEIAYCDVVVWTNFSHVAAINMTSQAGEPHFDMCQSAGGGPRMNEYVFNETGAGTFTRTGGIPAKDVGGAVWVISLWPE